MSYQVLARKYRPASFEELEGQEHVLRALVNALENDRLHHAYLFTGTRGVGKTTIARILARCLNCEKGITAKPCGECGTCLEITEGRSVDLIEVDAASRTKVEDTRELLDNVQYMPTRNRFKVYLIDEVHMLSTHSFNALLKTLEEPPEHVKFLLATTDPKKLPVTVLSRCLQFNLKNLSPERIVSYLQQILPVEKIEFEEPALWLLGRAADGSMRDALSLTDQAISFGNNSVREDDVKLMLGTIDQKEVYDLIDGLINQDAKGIMQKISQLAEQAPDYSGLLSELLAVLHRVALAQAVPDGIDNSQGDREHVLAVAKTLTTEDVQLYYQIGLVGQRDLPYAPNLKSGFEMILLRMLAFTPFADSEMSDDPQKKTVEFEQPSPRVNKLLSTLKAPVKNQEPVVSSPENDGDLIDFGEQEALVTKTAATPRLVPVPTTIVTQTPTKSEPSRAPEPRPKLEKNPHNTTVVETVIKAPDSRASDSSAGAAIALNEGTWVDVLRALKLKGVTLSVASNCTLKDFSDTSCSLMLDEAHASLWNKIHETRIEAALAKYYATDFKLICEVGTTTGTTPAQIEAQRRETAQLAALKLIVADAKVKQLIDSFDGVLDIDTITVRY
ncbi:MAG: DNA polymerase-3 subunit gamma/tau [Dinoroseobacter sp.]|jgi:DNA polymerase-3 subunit gamma/tau